MGQLLGIIAGGGEFPRRAVAEARRQGFRCVVAAIRGAAVEASAGETEDFSWFAPSELLPIVDFFRTREVRETVLVGKIEHRTIFREDVLSSGLGPLLRNLPDRMPTTLLKAFIAFLESWGIGVRDPEFLLRPHFCPAGILGRTEPLAPVAEDIAFGWPLAKQLADLDIGQTLVVKGRAVAAVEGMEGTDETILRGGRLSGPGSVVLKVGRTNQDFRLDIPAVGLETIRSLIRARAAALAFEAAVVPFFEKEEALALAEANGLVLIAR